jgi:hypothetical protein
MVARQRQLHNRLAVWLARRQQAHLSMTGHTGLARALGVSAYPESTLAPLLSRTVRVRRRRRFLPARVERDPGLASISLPVDEAAARIETLPEPVRELPAAFDEEVVEEIIEEMPFSPEQVATPEPDTEPSSGDSLADLPGLRALMRSVLPQVSPVERRPPPQRPAAVPPPRPVRPRPEAAGSEPESQIDNVSLPEPLVPLTPEMSPEQVVPVDAVITPLSDELLPEASPVIEIPDVSTLGVTNTAQTDNPTTPTLHDEPGEATQEATSALDTPVSEPSSQSVRDVTAPVEHSDDASTGSVAVTDEQAEESGFSPRYWLERLQRAERAEREQRELRPDTAEVQPGDRVIAPEPLAPSTRRFLRPLVGVDPESVPVYRETPDQPLVSRSGADAITLDDTIVLGIGEQEDSVEGLGLLAHELTHAARRRTPRFVPPVVRNTPGMAARDEEQIARQVESRVREAARREDDLRVGRPDVPVAPDVPVFPPPSGHEEPHASVRPIPLQDRDAAAFGGLPAPWEPLPDLFNQTSPSPTGVGGDHHVMQREITVPTVATASGQTAPVVQRAETGRTVPEAPAPEQPPPTQQMVEPDLDALARQVYAVLRRRLLAEQRRAG